MIATNTIAQGKTRELGLDYIQQQGGCIYRATNNQPWPGQAAVVVNVIHIAKGKMNLLFVLDQRLVQHISSFLDSRQVIGDPYRLVQNEGKSYIGSYVHGLGFTMPPEEAQALIDKYPKNAEVLFPYLIGKDFTSRPDQSPSRWVINFFDWPLEQAEQYPDCIKIVREKVYPERQKNRNKQRREIWWRFTRPTIELYSVIDPMKRVLFHPFNSKYLNFGFVPTGIVYAAPHVVIALSEHHYFAILQSSLHASWAKQYGSTLKTDLRYTPTDCFETFPFPYSAPEQRKILNLIGEIYYEHRRQLMLERQEGLTATYNRFHDPAETASDIARLRRLHVEMDQAVAAAYGWDDLDLDHGFHETPQGLRYTISEQARWEVLDRLLALNHERHQEEVRQGLHGRKKGGGSKRASRPKKKPNENQPRLF